MEPKGWDKERERDLTVWNPWFPSFFRRALLLSFLDMWPNTSFYLLEIIQTGFLSLSNHRAQNYKSTISPLQFKLKLQIFLGEVIQRSKLLLKYKWLMSAPFLRASGDYRFIWKQTGHCNSKGRDNQDLLHQVHKIMIQIQKTWIWSLALPLTGNLLNFSGYPFPHL